MNKDLILGIFLIILSISSIVLSIIWFGWKLLLILFLWTWANNLSKSEYKNQGGK